MRNESANATEPTEDGAEVVTPTPDGQPEAAAAVTPSDAVEVNPADVPEKADASAAVSGATGATTESVAPVDVPQQRTAEPEATSGAGGKGKKRKTAPKSKSAGMKSLVVFRDGKVHYADDTVVVLDLDDAAHPDTDVHDVVDKLSELRDAAESPGRTEAVALVAELIQAKALS